MGEPVILVIITLQLMQSSTSLDVVKAILSLCSETAPPLRYFLVGTSIQFGSPPR